MKRSRNVYHYQLKKCKKAENKIRKEKLLNAMFENGSEFNLFAEIKKIRKSKPVVANKIDDKTENIEGHFAGIYSTLYNSVDDHENLNSVANDIESRISENSVEEVNKVTQKVVKEALKKIKPEKSDPAFEFSSDCLKNAPDILHE